MKEATAQLIEIFQPTDTDWMGYTIESVEDLSFHHIEKKQDGGLYTVNNGALLNSYTSHEYLHLIETRDLELYGYINNLLQNINNQRFAPTKSQLLAVRSILEQFEREHAGETNRKGKALIKTKFIEGRKKW